MLTARTIGRRAVGLIAVAATLLLTGCSQPTQGVQPTPGRQTSDTTASSSSSGTPSSTAADARAAVEAAYRRFWAVGQTFDHDYPPSQWREVLARVATDPLLSRALSGARLQRGHGIVLYGQVILRPTVVSVSPDGRARVSDCQDTSRTGQADAKTGRRRTVGVPRTPVRATLVRGRDGQWRVSDVDYVGGRC